MDFGFSLISLSILQDSESRFGNWSIVHMHRGIGMIKIMDDFMGLIIAYALFAPFLH